MQPFSKKDLPIVHEVMREVDDYYREARKEINFDFRQDASQYTYWDLCKRAVEHGEDWQKIVFNHPEFWVAYLAGHVDMSTSSSESGEAEHMFSPVFIEGDGPEFLALVAK